jgi:hypothetical protein
MLCLLYSLVQKCSLVHFMELFWHLSDVFKLKYADTITIAITVTSVTTNTITSVVAAVATAITTTADPRLVAGVVSSNPARGMDVCLLCCPV